MTIKKNALLSALLLCSSFSIVNAASSDVVYSQQKINVYSVPSGEVNDLNAKTLNKYINKKPLYTISESVSSGKTMITTLNNEVAIVMDKNRNPIANYNDILKLAEIYAQKNIPLIDKERLSNSLKSAKMKNTYDDSKYKTDNNEELIVAIKENKQAKIKQEVKAGTMPSSTGIDFNDLSLMDNINYFIEHYRTINKTQPTDLAKDTRYHLVKSIKQKLASHKSIDSTAIDYSINLEELKLLKSTILDYSN